MNNLAIFPREFLWNSLPSREMRSPFAFIFSCFSSIQNLTRGAALPGEESPPRAKFSFFIYSHRKHIRREFLVAFDANITPRLSWHCSGGSGNTPRWKGCFDVSFSANRIAIGRARSQVQAAKKAIRQRDVYSLSNPSAVLLSVTR